MLKPFWRCSAFESDTSNSFACDLKEVA